MLFEVLVAVRAHVFKIDGTVPGGNQFVVLVQVLFWGGDGARACFHLDGRVQCAAWGAGAGGVFGCCLGCCLIFARCCFGMLWGAVGGAVEGAGTFFLD